MRLEDHMTAPRCFVHIIRWTLCGNSRKHRSHRKNLERAYPYSEELPPKRKYFLYRSARLSHVIPWDRSGVYCHALNSHLLSRKYQPCKGAGCRSPPFRLDPANHPTRRKEIPCKAKKLFYIIFLKTGQNTPSQHQ